MKFFSMRGSQEKREHITDTVMRRTLYTSVLTLALCIVCFLGTTWAWFTEEISSTSTVRAASFTVNTVYRAPKALQTMSNHKLSMELPAIDKPFTVEDSTSFSFIPGINDKMDSLIITDESGKIIKSTEIQAYGLPIGSWKIESTDENVYAISHNSDVFTVTYSGSFNDDDAVLIDSSVNGTEDLPEDTEFVSAIPEGESADSYIAYEKTERFIVSTDPIDVTLHCFFFSGEDLNGFSDELDFGFTVVFTKTQINTSTVYVKNPESEVTPEEPKVDNNSTTENINDEAKPEATAQAPSEVSSENAPDTNVETQQESQTADSKEIAGQAESDDTSEENAQNNQTSEETPENISESSEETNNLSKEI